MEVKLINEINPNFNTIEQRLFNRGIAVEDMENFLHTPDNVIQPFQDLDNITKARDCFLKHKNGFYVYAEPKKFKSFKDCVEYVTRYCGCVPISENRIINYDGNNVTFCYNAHEDKSYHEETVTAEKFILMLLRHLIPSNYKIIRYYGFYRKKHKLLEKLNCL